MADISAADILHDMKQGDKATNGTGTAHHENVPNEKSVQDIERTASHGAGYELNLPVDEHGEYVVTMKTWAVVVVSCIVQMLAVVVTNQDPRF